MAERGAHVVVEQVQAMVLEPLDVLVEGVDEDREGQVPLELRRGSGEHELSTGIGAPGQFGEEARLPDAGLTD